jgi:hypothetical protein
VSGDAAVQGDHATGCLRCSVDSWCDGVKLCVCVPMTLSLIVVEDILALALPLPSTRSNMCDCKDVSRRQYVIIGDSGATGDRGRAR